MTTLGIGEVHVWTARLSACVTAVEAFDRLLSESERVRANRYYLERHRLNYRFAHGVLRNILATYVSMPPEAIRFSESSFGKPFLVGEDRPVHTHFNMSHSGDVVVVAVTRGRHVGVDVELIRSMNDFAAIARSNFTLQECALIESSPVESQQNAFFRCWTRKEAFIKAVGKGLSIPLNTFDVSIGPGQAGRTLVFPTEFTSVDWWLEDVTAPDGYVGAVAIEQSIERLVYKVWEPVPSE